MCDLRNHSVRNILQESAERDREREAAGAGEYGWSPVRYNDVARSPGRILLQEPIIYHGGGGGARRWCTASVRHVWPRVSIVAVRVRPSVGRSVGSYGLLNMSARPVQTSKLRA